MGRLVGGLIILWALTNSCWANEWVSYVYVPTPVVQNVMVPVVSYVPVSYVYYPPVQVVTYSFNPYRVYWDNRMPVIYSTQYCWFRQRMYNYGY